MNIGFKNMKNKQTNRSLTTAKLQSQIVGFAGPRLSKNLEPKREGNNLSTRPAKSGIQNNRVRIKGEDSKLPKGWKGMKLGDVYNISAGGDFNPRESALVQDTLHLYPIYSNALTNKGLYGYSTYAKHDADAITITARGDIGIANYRETRFVAIGRLLVLKSKIPVLNKFVSEYINHKIKFLKETTGVPQLTIPQANLYWIVLPPLAEQRAIVSVLEVWDRAIEKTEQLISAKEQQFKWLLKKLISDQQQNPTWKTVKLDDICKIFKGKGLSKSNISKTGKNKCILYGELYTVYPEIIKEIVSRTNIENGVVSKTGDVLLPGSTTTKGIDLANATALFEDDVLLGGDINILRVKKYIQRYDSAFLSYCLTHSKKKEIANFTQGITIIHLYGKDLKTLKISLPKFEQQKNIAHTLYTAQKEIDLLKKTMEKYRIQKKGLMQKLLTGHWRLKI